jgi:hypothetical protein
MKIAVKFIVLIAALLGAGYAINDENMAAGITAAGAFIAFAWIETNELRMQHEDNQAKKEHKP